MTQRVPTTIKTVSIADSEVADVVVAGPREILVNGKAVGFTTLVVWDENNVSSMFNVVVRGAYEDPRASRWLSEQAGIPDVVLPFTVGGNDKATDLFGLFDSTLSLLVAAAK